MSGTCGGICEPIDHADQVFAEGSPVIRHLDKFHMNNRNTQGEAIFVRDMGVYGAPVDDDPVPGSLRGRTVALDIVTDAPDRRINFYQPPAPGTVIDIPKIPGTQPQPQPQPQPEPPKPGNPLKWGLRRLGLLGLLYWGYELGEAENQRAADNPEGYMANEAERFGGMENLTPGQLEIHERAVERLREGVPQGRVREEYYRDMQRERMRQQELELEERLREPELEEEPQPVPQPPPEENLRITPRPRRRGCRVGTYRQLTTGAMKCPEGSQAHHIMADYTLRYGNREEGMAGQKRIPGLPGFWEGPSICLYGQAKETDTEHWLAHRVDTAVGRIGQANTPVDTGTLGEIKEIYTEGAVKVKKQCEAEIRAVMDAGFATSNDAQLVRTKMTRPLPRVGTDTHTALKEGWTRAQFDDWVTAGRPTQ